MRTRTKSRRVAVAAGLVLAMLAASGVAGAQNTDTSIEVSGHGWGHGRGMGQYGSLGYALNFGWSSEQMLDHYYGDTVAGTEPNDIITIRLESASDQPTVAGVDSGAMVLLADDGTVTHVGEGNAIRLTSRPGGFSIADAPDCSGPFVERPGLVAAETIRISTAATERSGGSANLPAGRPVVGDWDGDGDDDLGVVRGDRWLLDPGGDANLIRFNYGLDTDTPFVGDWDGDGRDDTGLLRGTELIRRPGLFNRGVALERIDFVGANQLLIGDWDGDGIDQPGRNSAGTINLDGHLASRDARLNPNLPLAETIQRCVSNSEQRYYRGELRAVRNNGAQRTVNAVAVEWYLRAVVPREMPASWALLGNGAGAAALEAQAVSARSYSLAENRASYARTCDTISCQVYDGRATRINGTLSSNEHPLSDIAIADTRGEVRVRDGAVARTEFSSSTGGWSAGGVFPAVQDRGDGVSLNPNHDWNDSVSIASLEARYGGRTLDRIFVSERNGLGEDGGRVLEVTLEFGAERFTMSGNDFRRAAGLLSDWFSIDWTRGTGLSSCICPDRR